MPWIWCYLAVLVFGPATLLVSRGARWRWLFFGIASWMLGVFVKNLCFVLLEAMGESHWPASVRGVAAGTLSALCELGAAAIFLRRATVTLTDAVGFGAGIGSFEVLFVLGLGVLEGLDDNLRFVAPPLEFVTGWFLVERTFALLGHTASRVLLYVALQRKQWLPGVIGVVMFSLIDGLAAYGVAAGWDWDNLAVTRRFQIAVATGAVLETMAAIWFVRRWRAVGASAGEKREL